MRLLERKEKRRRKPGHCHDLSSVFVMISKLLIWWIESAHRLHLCCPTIIKTRNIDRWYDNVVFICRYAPALRQLRQVAFLVTFPPTIPGRLATRLLEVILSVGFWCYNLKEKFDVDHTWVFSPTSLNTSFDGSPFRSVYLDLQTRAHQYRYDDSDVFMWENWQWYQVVFEHSSGKNWYCRIIFLACKHVT